MNILILQGPLGTFNKLIYKDLEKKGHTPFKISFNGGDYILGGKKGDIYYDTPADFPFFIKNYITEHNIDSVVAYGDCRGYHKASRMICLQQKLPFIALEEGYLRPDFITVDKGGANANSLTDFTEQPMPDVEDISDFVAGNTFMYRMFFAMYYYICKAILSRKIKNYLHHRNFSMTKEALCWIRSGRRKITNKTQEQKDITNIVKNNDFFFTPLQVHNDSQIKHHSHFSDIEEFITLTVNSFARNANTSDHLVIKQHPMDRGYKSYKKLINNLKKSNASIAKRVHLISDFELPNLLRECKGCITINSTVGISSLIHNKATLVLGKAFYNLPEVTYQHELARFWKEPKAPNKNKTEILLKNIRKKTQVNASFYNSSSKNISRISDAIIERTMNYHH